MSMLVDPAALVRRDAEEGIARLLVGAVIDRDGQVLVLRREGQDADDRRWKLPSGTIEQDEDLLAALNRMVAEETGLKLASVTRYLGEFDHTAGGQKCRQHTWAVTVERSASVEMAEHWNFAWVADADERPVSREVRSLIRQYQHHTPEVPDDPWPLAGLVVRTPRLELRPDDDVGLRELALLGAGGVHPAREMPMGTPWTDAPPQQRARATMQSSWRRRAAIGPESWGLNWLIRYRGEVIGTQLLYADRFATTREVVTGSWLGLAYQGRGFGTEARAAVLQFAFECLGAVQARWSASPAHLWGPQCRGRGRRCVGGDGYAVWVYCSE